MSHWRARLVAALICAAGGLTLAVPASTAAQAAASTVVRVGGLGRPIPPGFLGLSFEFPAIAAYMGTDPRAVNHVFVRLVRNLSPGQAPELRIGGKSTDGTWWPIPHVRPPLAVNYRLSPQWLTSVRLLSHTTGAHLILGVNLEAHDWPLATAEVQAFLDGIGRSYIEAFEPGNEPELYNTFPWFYTPARRPVWARRRSYDFAAYTKEVSRLGGLLPGLPLAGPSTGAFSWLTHVPRLLSAEPGLRVVTFHRYPLIRCFSTPGSPDYPSVANLLSLPASRNLLQGVGPYIAFAHRHGFAFRVDEMNSVACKGKAGVSDTFASALWVLDTLFAMARDGVDGVNIHTLRDAAYQLFTFREENGKWVAAVPPEYYGLLLFAHATPPGSRLLPLSATGTGGVRSWATQAPDGSIHVVLINDSLTSSDLVTVPSPSAAGTGTLERLLAPSAEATGAVTLGGQSFGAQTDTGTLSGPRRTTTVQPVNGGYEVQMPAASAAMLTLPAPPRG
jgi:hypothetical protein